MLRFRAVKKMSSSAVTKCACVIPAMLVRLVDSATAASATSKCDVFEYYDASAAKCRHCDTACFEHENGTGISFIETRCLALCPGYIKEPRVPQYPSEPEEIKLTLMEWSLVGFLIALFIICVIVVIILKSEIYTALKDCSQSVKAVSRVSDVCGHRNSDVSDSYYVKLADPSDEVEIIERVTCL